MLLTTPYLSHFKRQIQHLRQSGGRRVNRIAQSFKSKSTDNSQTKARQSHKSRKRWMTTSSQSGPGLFSYGHMPIGSLLATQYGYRDDAGVKEMVEFVSQGGEFNAKPLIQVFLLEDGKLFVHDGHHRSMAVYLSGRDYLKPSEYLLSPITYRALGSVNFDAGYVTPYDPRTEMRLSDFRIFKKTARQLRDDLSNPHRETDAMTYITENRPLYCITHRPYETIPEMASHLGLLKKPISFPAATSAKL